MTAWAERAACRDWLNPDDFFPKSGDPPRWVKEACAGCPVRMECLEWAIKHERHGWWSNTGEEDRDAYRKEHNILLEPISIWPDRRPPEFAQCGTHGGAKWHQRKGEPVCNACGIAQQDARRKRKQRQNRESA